MGSRRTHVITLVSLLAGCAGNGDAPKPDTADDTADTVDSDDTGDTAVAPTDVSLADAPASLYGAESYAVGNALAFAGDDDGDGYDAAVVAASFLGTTCLVRGPVPAGPRLYDEADLCWLPEATRDYAGAAVAGGRDVTGDGVPDVLLGAIANDEIGPEGGKAYVLAGPHVGGTLADAWGQFVGEAKGDYAGTSVALLGDVDGDGAGDLLVGAPANDAGGSGGGRVYIVRGPVDDGVFALGESWTVITGEGPAFADAAAPPPHGAPAAGDGVGSVAVGAGDINGDGLADVLLGANGNELGGADAGAAAVFLGPVGQGARRLDEADQLWIGASASQYVGDQAAGPGDLDGDGLDDLLVSSDTNFEGYTWVIPGPGVAGTSPIADAPTRLVGEVVGDLAGAALAGAGDTDGDGHRDVLVGAYANGAAGDDAGAVYLVRGPFVPGVVALGGADRVWRGRGPVDQAGRALDGGGDLDADGLADVLIGAPYADFGAPYGGEVYFLFGP